MPLVVVAVGAAAGKSVVSDKSLETSESPKASEQPKAEPTKQAPEALSQEVVSVKPVAENNPPQKQTKTPEQIPQPLANADTARSTTPVETFSVVTQAQHLINKGWKVKLSEVEKNTMMDGILYFDANNNYYGFDGCKKFKGRFVVDAGNQLLIKTLIVSSKGSNDCGNEIERNLFFVNSFKLHDNDLLLSNNDKIVITLTQIDNFNANVFLTNAKVKYRTKKTTKPKS